MPELEPTRMPDGEIKMMAQQPQSPSIGRIVLFSPWPQPNDAHKINGSGEFVATWGKFSPILAILGLTATCW